MDGALACQGHCFAYFRTEAAVTRMIEMNLKWPNGGIVLQIIFVHVPCILTSAFKVS